MSDFKALSELKEFEIDTILKPSIEILEVNGVVYQMLKEIEAYGLKSGKNKRYNDSLSRLMQIQDFIDKRNSVNDHNYQLRFLLKNSLIERDRQNKKISDLEDKINKITSF